MISDSGAFAGTLLAISVSLNASNPAYAQANSDFEGEQGRVSQGAGKEIVVTAQKRVERLQDVPVSITVVDGRALKDLNLTEATDLQFLAAGVGFGDSNTPRGAGFRIRGVGTVAFADGIEQSVGTVVDGVPLARAGQGLADLIDVERIEVLRGPQGMLFGRNASAGLINIVTKRPILDVVIAEGRASYGSDNDLQIGASLNAPIISDVAGFRVTGFLNQRDGFVTNLANGQGLNARKEYGLRGSLLIEPSNSTEIILRGDWSRRNNRANIWTIRALTSNSPLLETPAPGTIAPVLSPQVSAQAGQRNRVVDIGGELFNRVESWGLSGEVNVALDDYTVTSVTAYRDWRQADNNDTDQSRFNLLDLNLGTNDLYQFSQELRLTSPEDQLVSFVAGVFYYESGNSNTSVQRGKFVPAVAQLNSIGQSVPLGGPVVVAPGDLAGRSVDTNIKIRDMAAFGQATLNLADDFKIILGARHTDTKVSGTFRRIAADGTSASFNLGLGAAFAPLGYALETTDSNLSYRAGIQYTPNSNLNFYATYSRGYKGPGFNSLPEFTINPGSTALESALVNPEIPTSYEAGIKATLANGTINGGLAVFRTEFSDFQAQVFEVPPGSALGSFRIRNAGKLNATGFELEVNARPIDGFSVGFGLAYTDTVFKEFRGAACAIVAQGSAVPSNPCSGGRPSFDASGLRAPNAPKISLTLNSRYDHRLSDGVAGFIQANALLRSDNIFALVPENVPNPYVQDGYVVVNLAAGMTFADGRFGVSAFAKNPFDQQFVTGIFDLPFGGAGDLAQYVTRDAERLVGVQFNLNF